MPNITVKVAEMLAQITPLSADELRPAHTMFRNIDEMINSMFEGK